MPSTSSCWSRGSLTALLLTFSLYSSTSASRLTTVLPLKSSLYGNAFDVQVNFGDQLIWVSADTGSSDLWVLGSDWTCHNGTTTAGPIVDRSKCEYGNETYTTSSTFNPINYEWLGVHFGAGNIVGTVGFEDVKVGNISISQQEIGVVNASTTGFADNLSNGILGLGHPDIAAIHPENYTGVSSLQLLEDRILYPTVLTRMAKLGVEPYFAMALDRTPLHQEFGPGGNLYLGTMPLEAHGPWVTVPVEITETLPASYTNGTKKITDWTTTVQAVSFNGKTNDSPFQAFVDSGNPLLGVPPTLAKDIFAAYDPPAKPVSSTAESSSLFTVACNATPPSNVSITIGGTAFAIDPRDMIYADSTGTCYSAVTPVITIDGISLFVLGDAFMKNVVAVFDFGKEQMQFAQRTEEGSASASASSSTAMPSSTAKSAGSAVEVYVFATVAAAAFVILALG